MGRRGRVPSRGHGFSAEGLSRISDSAARHAAAAKEEAILEATPADHIAGLGVEYVSGSSLKVKRGEVWIPSLGRVLKVDADITLSGLSLAANTWQSLYIYEASGGVPTLDLSTVAPVNADSAGFSNPDGYKLTGDARVKGSAASPNFARRHIRTLRTNNAGNLHSFRVLGGPNWSLILYGEDNATLELFTDLVADTFTYRDLSSLVPPTSRLARCYFNTNSNSGCEIDPWPDTLGSDAWQVARPNTTVTVDVPLTAAQELRQKNVLGSGATDIAVRGYFESR